MKRNISDLFDNFTDEAVDIKTTPDICPEKITEMTINKIREDNNMTGKKKISVPILAAAAIAVLSIGVFAAQQLLSPRDTAIRIDDYKLAESFSGYETQFNFEPQESNGYIFNILGIISGKNLSSFADSSEDKSYIVGAVTRSDGKAMTDFPDDIMVTPLVSGYKPWQVNAFTISGGRSSFLSDGVYYFIFECENLEIFADRTVYIAAYEGMAPGSDEFAMNPDGSICFNDSYKGAKALFTLPFDPSKADHAAVEKLFAENGIAIDNTDTAPADDNTDVGVTADDFKITNSESDSETLIEISEN